MIFVVSVTLMWCNAFIHDLLRLLGRSFGGIDKKISEREKITVGKCGNVQLDSNLNKHFILFFNLIFPILSDVAEWNP